MEGNCFYWLRPQSNSVPHRHTGTALQNVVTSSHLAMEHGTRTGWREVTCSSRDTAQRSPVRVGCSSFYWQNLRCAGFPSFWGSQVPARPRCYSIRIWLPILSLLYQGKHWIRFLFFTHMLWTHNFHFGTLKFFHKVLTVQKEGESQVKAPIWSASREWFRIPMLLTTLHGRSCTGNSHSWLITIQARASEHHRQVPPPRTLSRLRRKDILTQVIN